MERREPLDERFFNHEALDKFYEVLAVDPYALGIDTSDPDAPKVRLSYYSHQIIHAAGRIYESGFVDEIVLFGDASFGPNYPSTGDLMKKHLIEKEEISSQYITVFNGKDQNQTATQLKRFARYLKEQGLEGQEVLYLVWDYHKERVQNHAQGFGVNARVVPIEEIYGELNPNYDFNKMIEQLPLDEAEKMEAFRRKVSRYDKKGYIPRLAKPILGGSYMIDNYRKPDGKLGFEYKPGKQKLEELSLIN